MDDDSTPPGPGAARGPAPAPAPARREQRRARGAGAEDVRGEQVADLQRRLALAEAAGARLQLLADVSQVLVQAPGDLDGALGTIARRVVPQLAHWVAVDLLEHDGVRARRVALVHRDADVQEVLRAGLGPLPALSARMSSPLAQVLRGAPLQHVREVSTSAQEDDECWDRRVALMRRLGASQAVVAPLRVRGHTLGAITLVRTDAAWPFDDDDLALVADLADRAAATVDAARLLQREQHRAEQMQRALLPQLPARIGDVHLHGLYRPADDLSQVGGDWYDAFTLVDDGIALVLGDVAGHDLHAATRMSAIRHKLRAIAGQRVHLPSQVLTHLDRVLQRFAPDDVATLVYAHLQPEQEGWGLEFSCAGHLPPLLLVPGAPARLLHAEADLPLGVADLPRADTYAEVPVGASLVLYSDGLVERAGESLTHGLQRLVRAGEGLQHLPLELVCEELIARLQPAGTDDIAVLATRVHPPAALAP
ncbi:PP2C family protein-serine/threonine phosphatase [Kineococcus indalonis]|uniref:PP2C family protein-serine/threonine phosphatase n=1 Tax=Kineococcus indalonis TaxID=2696566 RepID=UPI0014130598|nr:PP2C family protein-serine/threonine phosphatase [Kineococcus indalonis]NAZ84834.1 SpoIIE family protein phosphatase [Kineococcus indalonis]